ncbi:MAG: response regulator [Rudaea sp.]|uniref:response regulator n=1 Tax=unclassified Rudaea TaxID=2627037 RepID=UPI0010F9AB23|nr:MULTISPECIES: response regulator [unclassified Rudaea]MBN8884681.1 response regulator [Rudaea sp.]MBR0344989.1 response regulator [Rudaea sp.]
MELANPVRILVADDDPVSLQFLVTALRELGCEVVGAADGGETLAACAQSRFDLLLLDRRMPDLGGAALLGELRRRGCTDTAIATSAELDAAARAELDEAGYIDAVAKPIGVERLAALLAAQLPQWRRTGDGRTAATQTKPRDMTTASAVLEDGPALASVGGDAQTLRALRGLFVTELEAALPRIADMPADELGAWLHRLRASCRYCGAIRLLECVERLELSLKQSAMRGDAEIDALLDAVSLTIGALREA